MIGRVGRTGGGLRRAKLAAIVLAALAWSAWPGSDSARAVSSLENPPPGANGFDCRPSTAHPEPVVLVHGLSATMAANWGYIAPLLAERGYCVFALTYGIDPRTEAVGAPGGVIPIQQSARELDAFVDRVLAETGAERVDLVGHSEGTYMPQFWLKFLGGSRVVDDYVAMTPLYDGTTVYSVDQVRDLGAQFGLDQVIIDGVAASCASCPQFVAGSPMQRKLTEGGASAPQVDYTTIPTRLDELVTPWSSGLIHGPGTDNRVLQEVCPQNTSEHAAVASDPDVAQLIFNALDPPDARPVNCEALPAFDGRRAALSGTGIAELAVPESRKLSFSAGDARPRCALRGAAERRLASCKIVVRTSKRKGSKLLAHGRSAAEHQTEFERAPRRAFEVDLKLTSRGAKLIRRGRGAARGRLVAKARDDLDRPSRERRGTKLR